MKRKKLYRLSLLILFAGSFGLFLVSAYHVYIIRARQQQEQEAFSRLAQMVSEPLQAVDTEISQSTERLSTQDSIAETGSSSTDSSRRQPLERYLPLYEQNNDFFAWLRIEGTNINYPVMFTPWDSEYYLRRAFDGTSSTGGTPFLDGSCNPDGSYYLIYGHHLSGDTMFSELPKYADVEYAREHPVIHLDTLYEQREYEVITAFYSQIHSEEEGVFRYYTYQNLSDSADFDAFIQGVQTLALYDLGLQVGYDDELLTLSTCNYHTQDGRFAVLAKRCK